MEVARPRIGRSAVSASWSSGVIGRTVGAVRGTARENGDAEAARRRLVQQLRGLLVPVLIEGSWDQIERDHRKVGLTWREDLEPGYGKPRYVARVLEELADDDVVALARRTLDCFPERSVPELENALWWFDAKGVAEVTEVTRMALARALVGRRLHPGEGPNELLGRFASAKGVVPRFEYTRGNDLVETGPAIFDWLPAQTPARSDAASSTVLALLDAYAFRDWPDRRLFQFLEFLVHPTVTTGDDQASLVLALNAALVPDRFELVQGSLLSGHPVFTVRRATRGVAGPPKNLIFASTGPKPELGLSDAVNNDVVVLRHEEHCLVFDWPLGDDGLRWTTLIEWWAARQRLDPNDRSTRVGLGERLTRSLASEPEKRLFAAYFRTLRTTLGDALPALVPQVYLHYDPLTLQQLVARGEHRRFDVQRMDFLLLLPGGVRVILEVDGQQHYSTSMEATAKPSPRVYAETVRADRHLRLLGYEVYRFGGYELHTDASTTAVVEEFFSRLFRRHKLMA